MIKLLKNFSIILFLLLGSCNKQESNIPNMEFRTLVLDTRQAKYSSLNIPGSFIEIKTYENGAPIGYGGLIVGKSVFPGMNNEDVYYAYDSSCPIEANRKIIVKIDPENNGIAECPNCKTQYNLNSGGYPLSGGKYSLKQYYVYMKDQYTLCVSSKSY